MNTETPVAAAPSQSDVQIYEARTNQMLTAATNQRDVAQYQVLTLNGEVGAMQQRLKNTLALNETLEADKKKLTEQVGTVQTQLDNLRVEKDQGVTQISELKVQLKTLQSKAPAVLPAQA